MHNLWQHNNWKSQEKGLVVLAFDSAQLAWSYDNNSEGKDFKSNSYNMTEIERDKVSDTEKKIYLAFSIYAEKHGYSISNDGLPSYQTAFEKLDALGQNLAL